MIQVGPFTLEGPSASQELDPPPGQVLGIQLINQGLWVLQAKSGGVGSFIPPGWCQSIATAPGAPLIVTMDPNAGPNSQTTLYANWLQQGDQPPPAGPATSTPPAPSFLDLIAVNNLLSAKTLYPSSLAWGILFVTGNSDFVIGATNQSSLDPQSLGMPPISLGSGWYFWPYLNIDDWAGPSVVIITWNSGHGNGSVFYEVDEPFTLPS